MRHVEMIVALSVGETGTASELEFRRADPLPFIYVSNSRHRRIHVRLTGAIIDCLCGRYVQWPPLLPLLNSIT
jgi:hypothetical protein